MEQKSGKEHSENDSENELMETARWETRSHFQDSEPLKYPITHPYNSLFADHPQTQSIPDPHLHPSNEHSTQNPIDLESVSNSYQLLKEKQGEVSQVQRMASLQPKDIPGERQRQRQRARKETDWSNEFIERQEHNYQSLREEDGNRGSVEEGYLNNDSSLTGSGFELSECEHCKRKFMISRLEKHSKVCAKLKKKRLKRTDGTISHSEMERHSKVKNSLKKSIEDATDYKIHPWVNESGTPDQVPSTATTNHQKRAKWKVNHENFIKNIRSARIDVENPPNLYHVSLENPYYTFCKYCERRFAPNVAAVHIPKCQHTFNRPKPPSERKANFLRVVNSSMEKKEFKRFSHEPKKSNQSNHIIKPRKLEPLEMVQKQSQMKSLHMGPLIKPKICILEQPETFTGILKNYQNVEVRSSNYSNIECPHCQRKFAEKAAERHIPICKELTRQKRSLLKETKDPKKGEKERESSSKLETPSQESCKHCTFKFSRNHKYCSNCGKKRGE